MTNITTIDIKGFSLSFNEKEEIVATGYNGAPFDRDVLMVAFAKEVSELRSTFKRFINEANDAYECCDFDTLYDLVLEMRKMEEVKGL